MAKVANKDTRTISSETMKDVMRFAPQDGFKLADDLLNKVYTVVDVAEVEFGTNKSFMVTLEDEDGKVINLSAAALKKARILSKDDAKGTTPFTGTENIFSRSNAEEIWNGSTYFHANSGMKKDEDFVLPEQIKLKFAVLAEDQETQKPMPNPFLYKGYRTVVGHYQKRDEFPTIEDFKEELLKTEAEGRISGLPTGMTEPTLQNWAKGDVSEYRHTLILADFETN